MANVFESNLECIDIRWVYSQLYSGIHHVFLWIWPPVLIVNMCMARYLWAVEVSNRFKQIRLVYPIQWSMKGNKCGFKVFSMLPLATGSTEWFKEDQTFSLSYDLAPPSTPSHLSPVSKLDRRHTGRLRKRDNLLTGEGGWGGGGAKSYDGEKAWSSINHSKLSD